jgi:hypothetical protein
MIANDFLDLTGALLYIIFSIVIFPLLFIANCFIWSVMAFKYVKSIKRTQVKRVREKSKEPAFQFPMGFGLAFQRR